MNLKKKEKKKSEAGDMTTGNSGKRILLFALPKLSDDERSDIYNFRKR